MTQNKTVIIIDDSATVRTVLKDLYEDAGFSVLSSYQNGEEYYQHGLNTECNLLSLDIIMPEADGIETLKRVIAVKPNQKIIIISTLLNTPGVSDSLRPLSNNLYLMAKPITPEKLQQMIKAMGL